MSNAVFPLKGVYNMPPYALKSTVLGTPRKVTVSGDGTPAATAASPEGQKTCDCPPHSKDCEHQRLFTSKTAQWCFHVHRGWVFGDECYTISLYCNGHDIPLITIMGGFTETGTPVNWASSGFRKSVSHSYRPQKFVSVSLTETHFSCSKHPSAEKMPHDIIHLFYAPV